MNRMGLERNRWVDPIDDFVRQHGRATPRWAIFLTYEIKLDRFARAVLPALARRGRRFRSVMISDQATLEMSLNLSRPQLPGAVNLHPIRCSRGGVFHPKLAFLRAGRHVRACFGSANITDGGMGSNLELWTSTESTAILGGIQHFLRALTQSPDLVVDDGARRSLRRALSGLVGSETASVWSSLQESFASRLKSGPERNAARATIISPMYAAEGGIKPARAAIPSTEVQLYTNMAVRVPKTSVFVYSPPHVADQADDAESFPRDLHAKAYVFRPRDGGTALAWMGSANFTAQALTKPVSKGGNVELMVRAMLPKDEADALDADLAKLFENGKALAEAVARDTSAPPRAIATILTCELVGSASEPRLCIYSTQRQGHVVLMNNGRRVRVTIKNRRGILEGAALRRLLPELDLTAAHVFVLYELVSGKEVPVAVNVPHVPPNDLTGGHSHASIDTLLDDLLGKVPISRTKCESGDEQEEDVGAPSRDGDDEADAETCELERRLDQVKHQGEIDQLAVKAALLKRLAVRATASGAERDSMFSDIVRVLLSASPCHLAPAIRSLFDDIDPSEST
jgi:hypothetical protein